MPVQWLRDSFLGQSLRLVYRPSWLAYAEEKADWKETVDLKALPLDHQNIFRVEWYSAHDEENPHNWSQAKKAFVLVVIGAYSFVVYMAAPIYTPSENAFLDEYHVNEAESSLGLALYV
ncbi:hypothetical protein AbraIFM66951_010818, partial [Aspergillus brasiliensis]